MIQDGDHQELLEKDEETYTVPEKNKADKSQHCLQVEERKDPNKRKDKSKLCNQYVWEGRCSYKRCIYSHKKLCRQLKEHGECKVDDCERGHNVDGICKRYNSEDGCNFRSSTCRYLHIKLGKRKGTAKKIHEQDHEKKESKLQVKDVKKLGGEEHCTQKEHERTKEEIEIMKKRVLDSLAKIDEAALVNQNDEYLVLDEVYSEQSEGENDQQNEPTDQAAIQEEYGERPGLRRENEVENAKQSALIKQTVVDDSQDRNNQGTLAENERKGRAAIIDRDMENFLRLGRQHDVWKEVISGTKAEIRKLEMEIRKAKRRQEDRDQ